MGDIASRKHSLHERWDGKNSVHYFYPFIHSFIQSITHSLVLQLFLLLPLSLVPPMLSSIAIYMRSTPRKIIVHPDNVHSFVHLISISKLLDSHSNCDDDTRSYKIHKTFQMKQQPQQQTTIQRCTTPKMVLEQRVDSCASTWQWHWTHWCLLWIVFGTDFFFGMQFDLRRKFWFMCLDQNVHASNEKAKRRFVSPYLSFWVCVLGAFFLLFLQSSLLVCGIHLSCKFDGLENGQQQQQLCLLLLWLEMYIQYDHIACACSPMLERWRAGKKECDLATEWRQLSFYRCWNDLSRSRTGLVRNKIIKSFQTNRFGTSDDDKKKE